MRRIARVLSVAAVTGAVLAGAGSPVSAEPAAEVSPAGVPPGGSVTVSVSCDPLGGPAPPTLDATSLAFAEETVALHLVPGNDDKTAGPAYRGSARIASAADLEGEPEGTGPDTAWTVEGTCPAAPGGQGKPWSATFTVTKGGATAPACHETPPHGTPCPPAPVQHGVRAGEGGAFTDSVPALVAGGLLIAGAFGGAVYRLRRKIPARHA
ncbi:hypothetical protein [Streptomyces sp. enrichment culture]|uniref:hypothetical protein n=1 Tax=Streptomyces sp. enrichment culture TaxID=1795815 RepID=UPI003F548639